MKHGTNENIKVARVMLDVPEREQIFVSNKEKEYLCSELAMVI